MNSPFVRPTVGVMSYALLAALGFGILNACGFPYTSSDINTPALPMMMVLAGFAVWIQRQPISDIFFRRPPRTPYTTCIWLMPYIAASTVVLTLIESAVRGLFDIRIVVTALLTLLIGIGEELIFRKLIFDALGPRPGWKAGSVALILSSVAFALLHLVNVTGGLSLEAAWFQCLSVIPFGFVGGLLYLATRDIRALACWHMIIDFHLMSPEFVQTGEGITVLYSQAIVGMIMDSVVIISLIMIAVQWFRITQTIRHTNK